MSYLLKSENRAITTVSALSEKRRVMITDCYPIPPRVCSKIHRENVI